MEFLRLHVGELRTCCYILYQPERDDCIVIDPGAEAKRILSACGEKRIAAVLLTHGHFDHIAAADELCRNGTPLYVHRDDADMIADPFRNVSDMIGAVIRCETTPTRVTDGSVIDEAGIRLTVIHTPGHTPGCVCYDEGEHLFSGDTLFEGGGYGRYDLPGGDVRALFNSLKKLEPIAAKRQLHGGH